MRSLTVLYDGRCAFCVRCQKWLRTQPSHVPLELLSCHSPEAHARYGDLASGGDELVVVADDGTYYRGPKAFLVCLHALRRTRPLARRLASPALLPLARRALEVISSHRDTLSKLLLFRDPGVLEKALGPADAGPACGLPVADQVPRSAT